jgi:hypothetical protein
VVVEEHGRPRARGVDGADEGGQVDRLLVEGAVEPPPHPLQDLDEGARGLGRARHPAREGAVEVRVGVDEARQDERAFELQHFLAGRGSERGPARGDSLALDPQADALHARRVEDRDRGVPQQHGTQASGRSRR